MLIAASRYAGKTTIGELNNLPFRWISYFYHESYITNLKASKNPEGPEAKQLQGQAMAEALTGGM